MRLKCAKFAYLSGLWSERLVNTVLIQVNAAAFIKFLALPMWRLFKGGVYFEITFLKSLTVVIINRL